MQPHYQIYLRKYHEQHKQLDLLNCELVSDAQSIVIMGASGSGKSLFLKSLAGLLAIDEGYIHFNGQIFLDTHRHIEIPTRQRQVSYLFQEFALFPHLTVAQNIALAQSKSIWSLTQKKAIAAAQPWLDHRCEGIGLFRRRSSVMTILVHHNRFIPNGFLSSYSVGWKAFWGLA